LIDYLFDWLFWLLDIFISQKHPSLLAGKDESKNTQASFREASPSNDDDYHHQQVCHENTNILF